MTVEPIEGATPTAERDDSSTDDAPPETASTETPVVAGRSLGSEPLDPPTDGATAPDTDGPTAPPSESAIGPQESPSTPIAGNGGPDGTMPEETLQATTEPEQATEPEPTAAAEPPQATEPERAAEAQQSAEATAIPPGAETADVAADAAQAPDAAEPADPTTDASTDEASAPRGEEAAADSAQGDASTEAPAPPPAPEFPETPSEPEAASAPTPAPRDPDRPEPTTMEELLSEQTDEIRSLKHGDVVEGNVVRIDKDEILVDIGAKSEGVVSNRELYGRNAESQPQLNIGDTVLVYVLQPESNEGHAVLSLRRAGLERKWRAMQEQLDEGVIIEAPVIDHNKGGLIVDCGIRGFVPISQIVDFPRRPQNEQPRDAAQEIAEKLQPYVGRRLRLKILEVNRKANRLILSEKVALYEERREKRDELFSSLQVGQKVTGSVRSIAPFGVFVDLGGIDGLVHKSELSWNKVNNPEAGYRVGEEVEAEVIDINHERGRISLSIRRLQPDPWHSTVADLNVGDIIEGTVTKIVNFGSFVRVRDGLEGLIHISELSHQRVAHPGDVVHEGQKLDLKVISLDSERHRLGLSLKQAEEAPARPAPAASEPRERRGGRQERSFDASQAVQEPEEGIDNTLAAAFAQVRQQVVESEAAAHVDEPREASTEAAVEPEAAAQLETEAAAEPEAEPEAAVEPEAAAQPEAAEEPEAAAEPDTAAEPEAAAEPDTAAEPETSAVGAAPSETTEPEASVAAEAAEVLADEPAADEAPAAQAAAAPALEVSAAPDAKHPADTKSSTKGGKRAAVAEQAETSSTDGDATPAAEPPAAETDAAPAAEPPAAETDAAPDADAEPAAETDAAPADEMAAEDTARS